GTKRAYADVGTQYSPAGYPPTYHPSPHSTTDHAAPASLTAPAIVDARQAAGVASAATAATESPAPSEPAPPEPALRVDPSPATAHQQQQHQQPQPHAQPQSARTPGELLREGQQRMVPTDAAAALNEDVPSSPAKRLRPPEANAKVLPLKYETCDVKDLGVLISDMLMELVHLNDGYPLRDGQLTRFHSR
ncbi:Pho80p cyclin, partial [Ascochyta clinopodiicola]